ncbi:MAG: hypothetical protein ACK5Q5_15645 [Planctomycetaceae bacterium]
MSEPLQEAFWESDRAKLLRWLPWLHLTRGFRLATRWQNLLLALAGVLLLAIGRWGISYLPFSSFAQSVEPTAYRSVVWPAKRARPFDRRTIWPCEQPFLEPPLPAVRQVVDGHRLPQARTLLHPAVDLIRPASQFFQRRNRWSQVADAWLNVLLVLAVGSLIGGAITRRVAMEFGIAQEPGLRASLAFAWREFPYVFGAPLISVAGLGLLLLLGRIVGWIGVIPGIGTTLAAILWGGVLLVSLLMALLLIGVAAAWPLMVAAHSCEGTDGFDALNRSYNYVFIRPWYALWLLLVAVVYGLAVLTFALWLTGFSVHLSEWMAAGPMSDEALQTIIRDAPALVASNNFGQRPTPSAASTIGGWWQHGLAGLLTAFVYSYFWTASTLIYLLLRKSCDACDLNRIYVPKPPAKRDGPPLTGIPAVEQREAAQAAATGNASASASSAEGAE